MKDRIDEYIDKCIQLEDWRIQWNAEQEASGKKFPDWNNGYIKKTLILRFMIYPDSLKMSNVWRKHFDCIQT